MKLLEAPQKRYRQPLRLQLKREETPSLTIIEEGNAE
jgi:hypothetical protein